MLNFSKNVNDKKLKIKFVIRNREPLKINYFLFFFLLCFLSSSKVFAQNNRRVEGLVTDTSKRAISDANVVLVAGRDTLRTTTDADGYFSFSKIKVASFLLDVNILGYQGYSQTHSFGKERQLELAPIQLEFAPNMLKTVEIRGKPNPMRVMQDTIEFNAAAYQVLEGDNVADLIKQFPGLEVDGAYNVKTMGKEMVKLRINGKDFFTNNIKDFIGKLPAGIVSKVQIIDDYGDEANFTGLKVGEPIKMLNIVTKPGMNKGQFGRASVNGGTNDQLGSELNLNLWNDTKQSSGGLTYGNLNNGAGINKNSSALVNHRDKVGKHGSIGISYNFNGNNTAFKNEQAVETVNPIGTFYTNSTNNGKNGADNHNLNSDFNFNNKNVFVSGALNAGYSANNSLNSSFNSQSGVIRQDLKNSFQSTNEAPRINTNVNFSKKLKNKKNSFSANLALYTSANNSSQNIVTNTLYYDKGTEVLRKDSLLTRDLLTTGKSQNLNIGANFGLGLKKPKDSLASQSLNFNYNISIGNSKSEVSTFVYDNLSQISRYVDSLSTKYTALFINQSLGISYNYTNKKMRYNLGLNVRPSLMDNNYLNLNQRVTNNNLNYTPNLSLSRAFSKGKTLSINYTGNNSAPSINQLQPIRNTQNLQNIVIGNPNLKPFFRHSLTSSYNYVNVKSGISLQSGLNFSATQNEIVTNVLLLPDTLNSLKQETRFENTNGTYSVGGNYTLNVPIKKNKYAISYGGKIGHSNRAIFVNNIKRFNKNFNLSQQIRGAVNLKKFSTTAIANYTFTSNTNVLNSGSLNDIYSLNLGQIDGATLLNTHSYRIDVNSSLRLSKMMAAANISYNITDSDAEFNNGNLRSVENLEVAFSNRVTINKTFFLDINASKRINKGYSLDNVNPLILSASLTKNFFKTRALSLTLNASDILNQGNNLSRYISGNSIIDSRTNQVTRVFSFRLSYNLSKFGGKAFRVDYD
ncbi:MAG: outer membrane beta-barrel protein [Bacteroidia bacterium]